MSDDAAVMPQEEVPYFLDNYQLPSMELTTRNGDTIGSVRNDHAIAMNEQAQEPGFEKTFGTEEGEEEPKAKKPRVKYEGPYRCEFVMNAIAPALCDFCDGNLTAAQFQQTVTHALMDGFYLPIERPGTDARTKADRMFTYIRGIEEFRRGGQTDFTSYAAGLREEFGMSVHKTVLNTLLAAGAGKSE